jgi:tape measure domain-containing protein
MADIKIDIKVVTQQAVAAVNKLNESVGAATKAVEGIQKQNQGFSAGLFKTATAAAAVGGIIKDAIVKTLNLLADAFSAVIGGGLELQAQIENLTFKFQALLPPTQNAKKFIEEIAELADKSPFEFPELAEAAQKLLTFGVEAENVKGVLTTLGDIATASGSNINELALTFAKATEAGVVTGRELQTFRNNGIPVIQALATELGVTTTAVKKLADSGKIDVATFEKALVSLSKEGGFAFDAMNKKALTLDGAQKKLHNSVEGLSLVFGQALSPAVILIKNGIASLITQFTTFLKESGLVETAVQILVFSFNILAKTGVILYNTIGGIRFILNELAAGITFLVTGAISLWLTRIQGILSGLIAVGNALGQNTTALQSASDSITTFKNAMAEVPKTFHESAEAIATDMTETSQSVDKFTDSVTTAYGDMVANAQLGAQGTNKAANDTEKGLTEAQKTEQQTRLQNQIKHNESMLAEQQRGDIAAFEQVLLADGELSAHDELLLLQEQDKQAKKLEVLQIADAQKQINQDIAFGVEATRLQEHQNNLALIKAKADTDGLKRENDIIKKKKAIDDAELKAQQERRRRVISDTANMFGALATLSATGGAKLFKITQAFNLAEALTAGYLSIQKAASALPPGANIPGIVAATAMAAANVIRIKQTQPQFADGGIVPGNSFSGDQVSARLNSGEMVLNRQQQANLFDIANNNAGAGGQVIQINNVIELDGEVVGRSVSRQVANGLKLGEVV